MKYEPALIICGLVIFAIVVWYFDKFDQESMTISSENAVQVRVIDSVQNETPVLADRCNRIERSACVHDIR